MASPYYQGPGTGAATKLMHIGLGAVKTSDTKTQIGFCVNDGVFSIDFAVREAAVSHDYTNAILPQVMEVIEEFCSRLHAKFVSAGISESLIRLCRSLPSHLWIDKDILPFVAPEDSYDTEAPADELADSMVRKALMWIGPGNVPRVSIASRNLVDVDAGGLQMYNLYDYESVASTVPFQRYDWQGNKLIQELQQRKVTLAFFSATPQGGRVSRMRHQVVRLFRFIGLSAAWYVPSSSPAASRITRTNHDILRGVADPSARLSDNDKEVWLSWIERNATQHWLSDVAGGVDVVVIDDHQMAPLIPIIKRHRPELPIIYRSHVEFRTDLKDQVGSPQCELWNYLWSNIQQCDLFIADPIRACVPPDVPRQMVALMPPAVNWLDGLNKKMSKADLQYYERQFAELCERDGMPKLAYPARGYICQVAPFDRSEGISDVLESYRKLRERLSEAKVPREQTPQLLITGPAAIDDPKGALIYGQALKAVEAESLKDLKDDIIIMRIWANDQLLNMLLRNSKISLQLSRSEGFDVKVSEALHKGIPVIAYDAGGDEQFTTRKTLVREYYDDPHYFTGQTADQKVRTYRIKEVFNTNGVVVGPGDTDAVAAHLYDLWTNKDGIYDQLSDGTVRDEVDTLSNAACWAYLAYMYGRVGRLEPGGARVYDLMCAEVGER